MKAAALISGGKDSLYAMIELSQQGVQFECICHLKPSKLGQELDSYMYQSVGSEVVPLIAEALGLPIIEKEITGRAVNKNLDYQKTENDEVEDLAQLITEAKRQFPEIKGVSSGAILSTYQKNRVEDICQRLKLQSLAPLWNRNQEELLSRMVTAEMDSVLVRVCSPGLKTEHLGRNLSEIKEYLISLKYKMGVSCCGEGGEFESITLDCPLYKKRIKLIDSEKIIEKETPTGEITARLLIHNAILIPK